jgi:hypothetical protein
VLAHWQQERFSHALETLRAALGDEQFEKLWTEGSEVSVNEAVARARRFIQNLPG